MTTAKQQRRARKKAHRPALRPDHDATLVAVVCEECGRHQWNRKAIVHGIAPLDAAADWIRHVVVDELADTVVVCKGCGQPYGRSV